MAVKKHYVAMQLQVLWLVFVAPAAVEVAFSVMASTPAAGQRPWCPSKCGDVDIACAYPFGIGDDCAWPGFNVSCNESFSPPRPYIDGNKEIMNISVAAGETRVYTSVLPNCFDLSNTSSSSDDVDTRKWLIDLTGTPFLVSPERNEFTATGCDTLGLMYGREDVCSLLFWKKVQIPS